MGNPAPPRAPTRPPARVCARPRPRTPVRGRIAPYGAKIRVLRYFGMLVGCRPGATLWVWTVLNEKKGPPISRQPSATLGVWTVLVSAQLDAYPVKRLRVSADLAALCVEVYGQIETPGVAVWANDPGEKCRGRRVCVAAWGINDFSALAAFDGYCVAQDPASSLPRATQSSRSTCGPSVPITRLISASSLPSKTIACKASMRACR